MNAWLPAEMRRVTRYVLITAAAYFVMELAGRAAAGWMTSVGIYTGKLPWTLRGICMDVGTIMLVLLHRRFTFRVKVRLTEAMLTLFIGANLWLYLTDTVLEVFARSLTEDGAAAVTAVLLILWGAVCYLLQRCVFYREAIRASGDA